MRNCNLIGRTSFETISTVHGLTQLHENVYLILLRGSILDDETLHLLIGHGAT